MPFWNLQQRWVSGWGIRIFTQFASWRHNLNTSSAFQIHFLSWQWGILDLIAAVTTALLMDLIEAILHVADGRLLPAKASLGPTIVMILAADTIFTSPGCLTPPCHDLYPEASLHRVSLRSFFPKLICYHARHPSLLLKPGSSSSQMIGSVKILSCKSAQWWRVLGTGPIQISQSRDFPLSNIYDRLRSHHRKGCKYKQLIVIDVNAVVRKEAYRGRPRFESRF